MIIVLGLEDQPNPAYILTRDEVLVLYQFLAHQYISYENIAMLTLVKEMRHIIYSDTRPDVIPGGAASHQHYWEQTATGLRCISCGAKA